MAEEVEGVNLVTKGILSLDVVFDLFHFDFLHMHVYKYTSMYVHICVCDWI